MSNTHRPPVIIDLEQYGDALELFASDAPGRPPPAGPTDAEALDCFATEAHPPAAAAAETTASSDDAPIVESVPATVENVPATVESVPAAPVAVAAPRRHLPGKTVVGAAAALSALAASLIIVAVFRGRVPALQTSTVVVQSQGTVQPVARLLESWRAAFPSPLLLPRGARPMLVPAIETGRARDVQATAAAGPFGLTSSTAARSARARSVAIPAIPSSRAAQPPAPPSAASPIEARPDVARVNPPPPAFVPGVPAAPRPAESAAGTPEPATAPPPAATPPAATAAAATPATAAPTAAAPSAAAPAAAALLDRQAIQRTLNQYRIAFSALDARGAGAVWPSVDAKALARAFEQLEAQEVEFDACDISNSGRSATARCGGRVRYVPKVGSKKPREDSHRWMFKLWRIDDRWIIENVNSR